MSRAPKTFGLPSVVSISKRFFLYLRFFTLFCKVTSFLGYKKKIG